MILHMYRITGRLHLFSLFFLRFRTNAGFGVENLPLVSVSRLVMLDFYSWLTTLNYFLFVSSFVPRSADLRVPPPKDSQGTSQGPKSAGGFEYLLRAPRRRWLVLNCPRWYRKPIFAFCLLCICRLAGKIFIGLGCCGLAKTAYIWGPPNLPRACPSLSHAMVSGGSLPGCVSSSCVKLVRPPIDTIGRDEGIGEREYHYLNKLSTAPGLLPTSLSEI
ncbi:hypothetical protein F5Y07DRAFT_363098 [Xylaria sp. FL0933]|nr:hypothetical protein F5Y07DRAFT_363098 [Xylaria sp. FL0933]